MTSSKAGPTRAQDGQGPPLPARLVLPARPSAAGLARRFVVSRCRAWGLAALCEDAASAVSELVANAVTHAASAATVTMHLGPVYLQVSVRDDSAHLPVPRPARTDLDADIEVVIARHDDQPHDLRAPVWHVGEAGSITAGRGLLIVAALTQQWGVTALPGGGKDVWFRLPLPTTAAADSSTRPR